MGPLGAARLEALRAALREEADALRPEGRLQAFAQLEATCQGDERLPARAVHARGVGAHGFFEPYAHAATLCRAGFLAEPGVRTPVFVRFSTVAGSRSAADTVRDVRGFAVRFYTQQGNYDLVGNNVPVFYVQDAVKFPQLLPAAGPGPQHPDPQGDGARDTFWDFAARMPETTHMLLWAMSDRALPRSLRMMEGFGVHSFRFIDGAGTSRFVKLHWKPRLGLHALDWDEAQKLAGADADFHRRDLWQAIAQGHFPEWELGVQVVEAKDADAFDFDLLDATKLIPEERVPVQRIGRMVLNRNPAHYHAETEAVAFHPGHLVPGIEFSDDPLLQGRLCSYTQPQQARLGGARFHELPINKAVCPAHNLQRDSLGRQLIAPGNVDCDSDAPGDGSEFRVDGELRDAQGFVSPEAALEPPQARRRGPSFNDHFSQARQFWISQSVPEQQHIVAAFQFELGRLPSGQTRQRMVDNLAHVDGGLALRVAAGLRIGEPDAHAATLQPGFRTPPRVAQVLPSAALSMVASGRGGIATRTVAILVADGVDADAVGALMRALSRAGASSRLLGARLGRVAAADGGMLMADGTWQASPSVLFDALFLPALQGSAWGGAAAARHFALEAFQHGKPIAATGSGAALLSTLGVLEAPAGAVQAPLAGVLVAGAAATPVQWLPAFLDAMARHRHWGREPLAAAASVQP